MGPAFFGGPNRLFSVQQRASICYNPTTRQIRIYKGRDVRLPASVQEIADVIGSERALYLVGQLPRCYSKDPRYPNAKSSHVILYVPKVLKPDHQLVQLLGWHDARRLVDAFGGEILQPGSCADVYRQFLNRSIVRMAHEGMKPAAIAELLSVSDRHVRNLLRENPQQDLKPANDNTLPSSKPMQAAS